MAGYYTDASGFYHGFVYYTEPALSQGCIQVDVPNSFGTRLFGINNQSQVIGTYIDANEANCYFIMDNGTAYDAPYQMYAFNDATQIIALQPVQVLNGCPYSESSGTSAFKVLSPI